MTTTREAPEFVNSSIQQLIDTLWPGAHYADTYEGEVFEIHPSYSVTDCTCGQEQIEDEWFDTHNHLSDCYQSELHRRYADAGLDAWGRLPDPGDNDMWFLDASDEEAESHWTRQERIRTSVTDALCGEMGLDPVLGCRIHCTCGYKEKWEAWIAANDHDDRCALEIPNFWHKPSDLRIYWYKYIGRSMKCNRDLEFREWLGIMGDCMDALMNEAENEGTA
jgi:hypothetical protein